MTDLDQRLHDLAERIDPPAIPIADDLARGRRRVRRRRGLVVAGAALAVVGVVGGAGLAGGGDESPRTSYAADPTPAATSTPTPTLATPSSPTLAPTEQGRVPYLPRLGRSQDRAVLTGYQRALSELLDPAGEHLAPWDMTNGVQGSGGRDRLRGIGTKLSWTNPGEDGLGMLQVFVSVDWGSQWDWSCDEGCRDVVPPSGTVAAQVHRRGEVLEVAVEHADGHVVALRADPLFGNNSRVPVSGLGLTEEQLLAAAAHPGLRLPE